MTNDEKITKALEQALYDDIAEYEKLPDHKFSRGFDKKMKRLIRNELETETSAAHARVGRRLPIAVIVIIATFLLMGAAATTYYLWNNFCVQDRGLYSLLNITDVENCPKTLEERYELMADLNGFTKTIISDEPFAYDVEYDNDEKNIHIAFSQSIKSAVYALNTEDKAPPVEVTVNGYNGIYYETKYGNHEIIWVTDDYLLDLSVRGIGKDELFSLARFVQKVE